MMQKCSRCSYYGPLESFPLKKNGTAYLQTCSTCTTKTDAKNHAAANKKKQTSSANKENVMEEDQPPQLERAERLIPKQPLEGRTPVLPIAHILRLIETDCGQAFKLDCFADLDDEDGEDLQEGFWGLEEGARAHAVARHVWQVSGWRFNFDRKRPTTDAGGNASVYEFYCAQREGKQRKDYERVPEPSKQRGSSQMTRYKCHGSLCITISAALPKRIRIRMEHHLKHDHYVNKFIDDEVKSIIESMSDCTASKIWQRVLRENPNTELNAKQIYYHWAKQNEKLWRLDDSALESAKKLLEKYDGLAIEIIPIRDEQGMSTIAFALKDVVDRWAGNVAELAIDSTWKTNSDNYELFGIVAEANGQGLPLAFMFTASTDGTATAGAKERLLDNVFDWLIGRGLKNVLVTLADKDQSEINSLRKKFPHAKHQSCYWHAQDYLKKRLAQDEAPARYDPREAHREFSFIDPTWAPGVSREGDEDELPDTDIQKENIQVAASASTCRPALVVLKLEENGKEVKFPVWPNPPKYASASLPEFCPKEHRGIIVEKFRRHMCMHPLIPLDDECGTHLSSEDIRLAAVKDMYTYCFENGLSQAWAYLWNRWYCASFWPLWARSASPFIARLRTTMLVESLWKDIKRRHLRDFNRPRIDLVTYIFITNVLPGVINKLDYILDKRRCGQSKPLSAWQKAFKHEWMDMGRTDEHRRTERELTVLKQKQKATAHNKKDRAQELEWIREDEERERGTYHTDIHQWTCSCPSFLLSRFLLCKHLVRMTNAHFNGEERKQEFFRALRRRHTCPFYYLEGLHDEDLAPAPFQCLPPPSAPNPSATRMSTARRELQLEVDVAESSEYDNGSSDPDYELDDGEGGEKGDADDGGKLNVDERQQVDGVGRARPTEAYKIHLKRKFDSAFAFLVRPEGMHPKLLTRLQDSFKPFLKLTADIEEQQNRRKLPRTWSDSSSDTLYLD